LPLYDSNKMIKIMFSISNWNMNKGLKYKDHIQYVDENAINKMATIR
jgi:hypothetical protein